VVLLIDYLLLLIQATHYRTYRRMILSMMRSSLTCLQTR